ncbi:hypothetical protein D3C80_1743720 [compost metagenome]
MLETDQVHCRGFQFQLQSLLVQCHIEASDPVLVSAQAAVFVLLMVVVMIFAGIAGRQRQQGKRQGKQQTAHGDSPRANQV